MSNSFSIITLPSLFCIFFVQTHPILSKLGSTWLNLAQFGSTWLNLAQLSSTWLNSAQLVSNRLNSVICPVICTVIHSVICPIICTVIRCFPVLLSSFIKVIIGEVDQLQNYLISNFLSSKIFFIPILNNILTYPYSGFFHLKIFLLVNYNLSYTIAKF